MVGHSTHPAAYKITCHSNRFCFLKSLYRVVRPRPPVEGALRQTVGPSGGVDEHQVDVWAADAQDGGAANRSCSHSHTKRGLLSQTHKRKSRLESQRALEVEIVPKDITVFPCRYLQHIRDQEARFSPGRKCICIHIKDLDVPCVWSVKGLVPWWNYWEESLTGRTYGGSGFWGICSWRRLWDLVSSSSFCFQAWEELSGLFCHNTLQSNLAIQPWTSKSGTPNNPFLVSWLSQVFVVVTESNTKDLLLPYWEPQAPASHPSVIRWVAWFLSL